MMPPVSTNPAALLAIATPASLPFVLDLQRKFSNQLGFLPREAVVEYIDACQVLLVRENSDPAGFIITRPRLRSAKWCRPIIQAAIAMDAQRRHLGLTLVEQIAREAKRQLMEGLQCWCADDIDARDFWKCAGFTEICRRDPKNARSRRLILYRRHFNASPPAGFWTPPTVAGCVPRRINSDFIPRTAILFPTANSPTNAHS